LHIIAAVLIIALAVGLYKAKTDAARTEAHVRDLQGQVEETESDMRALRAEIAHLESPSRVEDLAESHLAVSPGSAAAALPESAIAQRLPAPREQKAGE